MGRPRKERPDDPILARAREENPRTLPALWPANRPTEVSAEARSAASALRRLEYLEREIRALNSSKSDVYRELRERGYDAAAIRRALRERRLAPEVRAEREAIFAAYWDQLNAALDAAEAEEAGE